MATSGGRCSPSKAGSQSQRPEASTSEPRPRPKTPGPGGIRFSASAANHPLNPEENELAEAGRQENRRQPFFKAILGPSLNIGATATATHHVHSPLPTPPSPRRAHPPPHAGKAHGHGARARGTAPLSARTLRELWTIMTTAGRAMYTRLFTST